MHAPLEPPKGYEHFHTPEAVFPGIAGRKGFDSFDHFKICFRGGLKLYWHHYFPDPEILAQERREAEKEEKELDESIDHLAQRAADAVVIGREKTEEAAQALEDSRPAAQAFMQGRLKVFQQGIGEFAAGFKETISGEKNVWGQTPEEAQDDEDDDTQARVIYIVQDPSDKK